MAVPTKDGDAARPLGEFGRIDRLLKPLARGFPGALDLTDDAAVVSIPADEELVVTVDAMVAGVHFLADEAPGNIAAKLLRVNLSDLAAMAAEPLAYALVTALPQFLGDDWMSAFVAGLAADQRSYGVHLLGGDSVSTPGPANLTVTAFGRVPKGRALTRRTGGTGEAIFVTGTIGDAVLGLLHLQGELGIEDPVLRDVLLQRMRRPEPRVALVPLLRRFATAGVDVSDGLVADLGHILEVSERAATIHADRVPLSAATRVVLSQRPDLMASVLTGGDDYEIVFTVPMERRQALLAEAPEYGVPVTEIGRLTAGAPGTVEVLGADGNAMVLERAGWTHF